MYVLEFGSPQNIKCNVKMYIGYWIHQIIFPYVYLPWTLEKVFCKFSGILEEVLFGATIEEESNDVVDSEIPWWSLDDKGLLFPPCCRFISEDKAAAESTLQGDDVISPVIPSTYIRIPWIVCACCTRCQAESYFLRHVEQKNVVGSEK